MVGQLKVNTCSLNLSTKATYWASYCSLCANLRKQQGLPATLLLNNDITLLLMAFYDQISMIPSTTRCPAKALLGKQTTFEHQIAAVGAEISLVLAWIKATDNATDQPNAYHRFIANRLATKAHQSNLLSPMFWAAVEHYLQGVRLGNQNFEEEQTQTQVFTEALVREIASFTTASPAYTDYQVVTFGILGKLISVADHLIDCTADLYQHSYNPIIRQAETTNVPLATVYEEYLNHFYALRQQLTTRVQSQSNTAFAEALTAALRNITAKIKGTTPTCVNEQSGFSLSFGKRILVQRASADQCCGACCEGLCGACCESCCNSCCDSIGKKCCRC